MTALADDPDGPPSGLRIELVTTSANLGGGTGGTISAALSPDGRQVTITPGNPANGQGEIYFHVVDERGAASEQAVIRIVVNRPPSAPPGNIARLYGNNESCTFDTHGLRPGRQHRQRDEPAEQQPRRLRHDGRCQDYHLHGRTGADDPATSRSATP